MSMLRPDAFGFAGPSPKSEADSSRATQKSDAGRRSVPIPERLVPALKARLDNRQPGAPAVASPRGSRLGLENWKRSVNWKAAITNVGRDKMRVHGLRHTYASLSRRACADLRCCRRPW